MKRFKHITAQTVEEAAAVLAEYGKSARVIAGGTDLLGELKDGILREADYPEVLVNIKEIPGLDHITPEEGKLRVGALTRLEDLARHEVVRERYPALAQAARRTASPHIREMGTVAGNICQNNRCWYYWVPDNLFDCLRKGGRACYAVTGDARYHSIFGAARVETTACSRACPNHIDIAPYLADIRGGDPAAAARTLLRSNPLPAVTGRVCPHWCEQECARGEFDEAVAVRAIERFLGDHVLDHAPDFYVKPASESGKRVAVVGSGPAGLSAAYYLRQAGHQVTVMERMPEAGGMLAYGIPPYRLPREVLRRQVKAIEETGVEFTVGVEVDSARFLDLRREYDAVFVAAGASRQTDVGIAGEECLLSGTEFLRQAYEKPEDMRGKTVGVIGGGNTAIDVARALLRLGAKPIIYYRRTKDEMPALDEEIAKAEEEGVVFEFLTQPVAAAAGGAAAGGATLGGAAAAAGGAAAAAPIELTCCRMELGELDESGRPRPVKVEGSEFSVACDVVIKAIVERPDYSFLPSEYVDERGRLRIDAATGGLGDGVFAGGDFVTGPATVAEAIAAGKQAALAIDRFLRGMGIGVGVAGVASAGEPAVCTLGETFSAACMLPFERVEVPELTVEERVRGLELEEVGALDLAAVSREAERCFNCGCVAVNSSDLAPALVALGAKIKTSHRVIEADEFFTVGVNTSTVLEPGELVLEVQVPEPPAGTASTFIKFALRKSIDFPVVNVAAAVTRQDGVVKSARICLNSVFGTPLRALGAERYLVGKTIDERVADAAAEAGMEGALALLNNRYKIQIARTLVKRAILACAS
jgi:NADPH-dependent glutamate synthase beta subunit-like oxidoreductase